jgi:hypothetical protein
MRPVFEEIIQQAKRENVLYNSLGGDTWSFKGVVMK